MRLKSAVVCSALALTLAASAASAQAAVVSSRDLPTHPISVIPPTCPPGEKAVWVDQPATPPQLYIDPRTGQLTWIPGLPEFHGWQCQPITLVPVGP